MDNTDSKFYDPEELKHLRSENKRLMAIVIKKQAEINKLTAELVEKAELNHQLQEELDRRRSEIHQYTIDLHRQTRRDTFNRIDELNESLESRGFERLYRDQEKEKAHLRSQIHVLEKRLEAASRVIENSRRPILQSPPPMMSEYESPRTDYSPKKFSTQQTQA